MPTWEQNSSAGKAQILAYDRVASHDEMDREMALHGVRPETSKKPSEQHNDRRRGPSKGVKKSRAKRKS